jgi:CheY-like chemotaxis protein
MQINISCCQLLTAYCFLISAYFEKEGGIMDRKSVDILLIEDNPDHVELILKALRGNNLLNEVHVVVSGEEAMDFVYQRGGYANVARPGLILLDIKLPGMDGIEFLRRIKADPNLKSIPVVMLTTSAGEKEIVESYNCGVNSYIVKPVDFEQFLKVIKDLKLYWVLVNSLPR